MNGLSDGISMRGILSVTVHDAITKEKLRFYEIRNKITFLAADTLVELWAQRVTDPPDPAYQSIFSMRMGSSNTPASRSDTNLGAFVAGVQLLDVDKVTGIRGELQFIAVLGTGDANGNTLQEAGLFTRGSAVSPTPSDAPDIIPGSPRIVARQVHPAIPKTSAITVSYSWRVAFSA